ncbi:MAG: ECF transporter S component [Clostridia bacterium]|nr:ECF transporter S component [Clostridia bacterium]
MKSNVLKKLVLSGMFLAIGLVLPFFTGQIREIGKMLLPMHIPVMLCGLICGAKYGLTLGISMPLLRSFLFGMPVLYPNAVAMAFELAAYGCTVGLLFGKHPHRSVLLSVYRALIPAMLVGRLVWGVVEVVLLGFFGDGFTFAAFLSGSVLSAIPGILLQLVLIPSLMLALYKAHLLPLKE